jgi:5-(carboxyamino)imidazole ribonucleotide synthase
MTEDARDRGGSAAATLGVVGGGQLGRMLAEAAPPLGVEVVVLDPTPDCPAAPVAREQVVADFDDAEGIAELAERSDALTVEIELAGPDALRAAADAEGVPVHPSPDTLELIRDKLVQKRHLAEAGVPVPDFRAVDTADELRAALDELGTPAMVKARTGGYDGRGNVPIEDPADAERVIEAVGGPAMVEAFVDFERELSVIAAQGEDERAFFEPGENVHREEILRETVVPARTSEAVRGRARAVAGDVLELLDGRGVFGIELFEADGEVLVNEIAPRPHNSGHWTIEGARTSQFEQHVRATLGYPLGSTQRRDPTVSTNVLGDVSERRPVALSVPGDAVEHDPSADAATLDPTPALSHPDASLHWYGKRAVYELRKMGHVTLSGERGVGELLADAEAIRDELSFVE